VIRAAASAKFNFPRRNLAAPIMPGKVNPVMCESVMMVCAQVIANDATITWAGRKRELRAERELLRSSHPRNLLAVTRIDLQCRSLNTGY